MHRPSLVYSHTHLNRIHSSILHNELLDSEELSVPRPLIDSTQSYGLVSVQTLPKFRPKQKARIKGRDSLCISD